MTYSASELTEGIKCAWTLYSKRDSEMDCLNWGVQQQLKDIMVHLDHHHQYGTFEPDIYAFNGSSSSPGGVLIHHDNSSSSPVDLSPPLFPHSDNHFESLIAPFHVNKSFTDLQPNNNNNACCDSSNNNSAASSEDLRTNSSNEGIQDYSSNLYKSLINPCPPLQVSPTAGGNNYFSRLQMMDHQVHNNTNNNYSSEDVSVNNYNSAAASMAAMREMIFRVAAMQPISIDPATIKRPKRRNVRISKDPQSVAARHRRERISERIRILQRLVPGGTKMDTASMLDEAIHYVKFLKRQVQALEAASSTAGGGALFKQFSNLSPNPNQNSLNFSAFSGHSSSSPSCVPFTASSFLSTASANAFNSARVCNTGSLM